MLEQTMKGIPLMGFMRNKPAKPGELYGVPSGGSSQISMVTGLVFIALWFVVTEMGWVKPLFLPSPIAVWDKFIIASTEGVANSTLAEHTFASLSRVLGAFVLATRRSSAKRRHGASSPRSASCCGATLPGRRRGGRDSA